MVKEKKMSCIDCGCCHARNTKNGDCLCIKCYHHRCSKNNSEFCSFCSVKLPDKEYRCCERCREQKRKYNANRQLKKKLGFTKIREKLLGKENDTALLCNWEYHVTEIEKKQFCRTFKETIHPIYKLIDKYEKQRLTKKIKEFFEQGDTLFDWKRKKFQTQKKYFHVSEMGLKDNQFFCLFCEKIILRSSLKRHQKSKRHQKFVCEKQNCSFITL